MASSRTTTLRRPAALACLACRQSHLKCNGGSPACARCASRQIPCDYTPSRRGCRRKRRISETDPTTTPSYLSDLPQWMPASVSSPDEPIEAIRPLNQPPSNAVAPLPVLPVLLDESRTRPGEQLLPSWIDDEQLVNLYYLNFHNSHPILLPRRLYWDCGYPRFVRAVVEFIGSQFSPAVLSDELRDVVRRELGSGEQNTPEMVQARVLYTIALFARNEIPEGQRMLDQAVAIAMELGMHRRDFAAAHSKNRPVVEESMRRTWYELYVTDGCIAAFQRQSSFKTHSVSADILLPCEERVYGDELQMLDPASREDFEGSMFADEEIVFSSFSYRIEAVRLLGRVLIITRAHGVHRDQVQAVDNALAAFLLHLPLSKSEPEIMNTYGELDELMFQAHMVIQYATILLHFPRGDLVTPDSSNMAVPGATNTKFLCSCMRQHVHSLKAIDASKILSMLAAFRLPLQRHTPFFIYPLAISVVVQLSICAIHMRGSGRCVEQHHDRVKLMLGVLKSISRCWPIAEVVLRALKKMASAVFQPSRLERPGLAEQGDALDIGVDPCLYATSGTATQGLENFDLLDIQELIGLDIDNFCL